MTGGAPESGIYTGTIRHRRFGPVAHAFEYPLFMVLIDIDYVPEIMGRSRLTSHNRINWASFHDADHLSRTSSAPAGTPVRQRLEAAAASSGLPRPPARVLLLTHLRYLGYVFNPVSFFYGFTAAGSLDWVVAEVNNTYGGSHLYWLGGDPQATSGPSHRAAASKRLYVSPFMPADLAYEFGFTRPGNRLGVHIDAVRSGERLFDATLSLVRHEWTAAAVRRALLRHPWMTATVIAGIHWQALKLWRKGVPMVVEDERATKAGGDWDGRKDGVRA